MPVPPALNPSSSQNVSAAACQARPQPPKSWLSRRCRSEGGGDLSLSALGSAMCGAGTVRVINNNEKLGLPWIWCSIYNVHLSQHPDPRSNPGKSGAHSQPRRVLLFLTGALRHRGRHAGVRRCPSSPRPLGSCQQHKETRQNACQTPQANRSCFFVNNNKRRSPRTT